MSHQHSDGYAAPDTPSAEPAPSGPLDLQLLRTFLAVHRSGSFTAAAQLLRLSQPTVTTQIRSLEKRLGHTLFERLPRGVSPTADANDLAARVAGPLDALEVAVGWDFGAPAAPPAPLRLAGPAEILSARILPALAPLTEEGVRLRVRSGLAEDLLDELRSGRHDLVVSPIRPRGRALRADPLMDEDFVLVANAGWAERIGSPCADAAVPEAAGHAAVKRIERQGPTALCGVPLVTYAEDLPIVRRYWRHVFGVRLAYEPAIVVPDLRGVLAAVVNGAGVTVLPRYLCETELADGRLVALLEPEDPPINTAYLVRRPGPVDHPHLARVHDVLRSAARDW
ncbi:LysR family transcriptional regulator [Nocardiopsis sp. NRRL B-16309]|uniref:LysR family transcriptional regulator n=1 Tax=Nocardiopsis sp. NRRL B-16309 TaxID=1519494 RepID=UPI000A6C9FE0|nr:LysR family transcriptional regulator [Nocardiopsis sp. NRRL B-16309]